MKLKKKIQIRINELTGAIDQLDDLYHNYPAYDIELTNDNLNTLSIRKSTLEERRSELLYVLGL